MDAPAEELADVEGLGPIIARSIATWFSLDANRAFIEKLRAAGVDFGVPVPRAPKAPQTLTGKAVVVSGTLEGYTREEAEQAIIARGGKSPGSVSAKTFALVTGDSPGASKVTKAEQAGVPILDGAGGVRGPAGRRASCPVEPFCPSDTGPIGPVLKDSSRSDDGERPAVRAGGVAAVDLPPEHDPDGVGPGGERLDRLLGAGRERQRGVARLVAGAGRELDLLARLDLLRPDLVEADRRQLDAVDRQVPEVAAPRGRPRRSSAAAPGSPRTPA